MNENNPITPPAAAIADRDISLTFAKGMTVLKAFDAANTHLTLPQIARIAGLERATARRLVLTLVHLGYVNLSDRVFSLTPRILVLAGGFLQGRQFGKAIEPILRAFSMRIGEPISMAMIDGYEGVYVAHAGSDKAKVSIGLTVGSRVPLLQTAIGRALVSHVGPELTQDIIDNAPLRRFTSATVEDREAIRRDIALTFERGHAFVDGEFEPGIAAIAVPIGPQGPEAAALGISGQSGRFAEAGFRDEVVGTLSECGAAVSGLL